VLENENKYSAAKENYEEGLVLINTVPKSRFMKIIQAELLERLNTCVRGWLKKPPPQIWEP